MPVSAESTDRNPQPGHEDHTRAKTESPPGSEIRKKGGADSAKRQAERDWQDSAKESGD